MVSLNFLVAQQAIEIDDNWEPVADMIEKGDLGAIKGILQNPNLRKLLAKRVRSGKTRGKGRPKNPPLGYAKKDRKEDGEYRGDTRVHILGRLYYYQGLGIPVKSENKDGLRDGADIVAEDEEFKKEGYTRRQVIQIWDERNKKPPKGSVWRGAWARSMIKNYRMMAEIEAKDHPEETKARIDELRKLSTKK